MAWEDLEKCVSECLVVLIDGLKMHRHSLLRSGSFLYLSKTQLSTAVVSKTSYTMIS
jgi:hypothetical protein